MIGIKTKKEEQKNKKKISTISNHRFVKCRSKNINISWERKTSVARWRNDSRNGNEWTLSEWIWFCVIRISVSRF